MKKEVFTVAAAWAVSSFLFAASVRGATNDLTGLVQKGLFEEEANHNLEGAVASYQAAVNGYDSERALAATAIFRLGECYRKLGRTNEADAQYARVIREFPDQTNLTAAARGNLSPSAAGSPSVIGSTRAGAEQGAEAAMTSDEQQELIRVREMAQSSPDVVRTGGFNGDLETAVQRGWLRVARFLLAHGARPDVQSNGILPLCSAVATGNNEMVQLLLEQGGDVNALDHNNKAALDYAAELGFQAIAQTLIDHGAKVQPALNGAAGFGREQMVEFLLAHGAKPNGTNEQGDTPLMAALAHPAALKLLIDAGADVNQPSRFGLRPVDAAIENDNTNALELLLSHGANPNIYETRDVARRSPDSPFAPAVSGYAQHHVVPLMLCFGRRNAAALTSILLAHGANPNLADEDGMTPLDYAIDDGQTEIVQALIAAHADVNATDKGGNPPLAYLEHLRNQINGSHDAIREILLAAGANQNYLRLRGIHVTQKGTGSLGNQVVAKEPYNLPPTALEVMALCGGDFGVQFPDLAHITLDHLQNGTNESSILDLASLLHSGDCSRDPRLDWGDVLEVPQLDHRLNELWPGLPADELSNLVHCTMRFVRMVIDNQTNRLVLLPGLAQRIYFAQGSLHWMGGAGFSQSVQRVEPGHDQSVESVKSVEPEHVLYSFDLQEVVRNSGFLRLSSDLSRVKVISREGAAHEFNLEVSSSSSFFPLPAIPRRRVGAVNTGPAPNYTLQDGDTILIPEKAP